MSLNQVSFDIVELLAANGFGVSGEAIFMSEFQDAEDGSSDSQIVVADNDGTSWPLKEQLERPEFQILVRGGKAGSSNETAVVARGVHEFLIAQLPTIVINGSEYKGFEPMNAGPVFIGRDDSDRPVYSSNYFTFRNPI